MHKLSILIVEDEPEIAELMRFHAQREGYDAAIVSSGRVALKRVGEDPPSLVLLDLMLPDLDGLEVCRRLKWQEETRELPIIIVSAKGDESDIVAGIELGADDYVTKPFSPKVLLARIRNVLRRRDAAPPQQQASRVLSMGAPPDGELVIDLDRHIVTVGGRPVELTITEFNILEFLAARPGFVRTRDQIIAAVHGESVVLSSRTIDVHVTALRRKLGDAGAMIQTVRGVGYRLSERSTVPDDSED